VLAITLAGYESADKKRAVSLNPFAEESLRAAR
jgi:hypothetical protein